MASVFLGECRSDRRRRPAEQPHRLELELMRKSASTARRGAAETGVTLTPDAIVLNEILASTDRPSGDYIELY